MGLSNAERQARWRERRRAEVETLRRQAPAEPLRNNGTASLEAELAEARRQAGLAASEIARLKFELAELLKAELARPLHNGRGADDIPKTVEEMERRRDEIRAAKAAARQAKRAEKRAAETLPDPKTREELERQIKSWRTRALNEEHRRKTMVDQFERNGRVVLDKAGYRLILSCLHPDRVQSPNEKERHHKATVLFQALGFNIAKD